MNHLLIVLALVLGALVAWAAGIPLRLVRRPAQLADFTRELILPGVIAGPAILWTLIHGLASSSGDAPVVLPVFTAVALALLTNHRWTHANGDLRPPRPQPQDHGVTGKKALAKAAEKLGDALLREIVAKQLKVGEVQAHLEAEWDLYYVRGVRGVRMRRTRNPQRREALEALLAADPGKCGVAIATAYNRLPKPATP